MAGVDYGVLQNLHMLHKEAGEGGIAGLLHSLQRPMMLPFSVCQREVCCVGAYKHLFSCGVLVWGH